MVKRIIFIGLTLIFFVVPRVYASVSLPEIEDEPFFNNVVEEMSEGKFSFDATEIIKMVIKLITDEITESRKLILSIVLICAVSSSAYLIGTSFGVKGVGEASFYACFCIVCSTAIRYFCIALEYAKDVVTVMSMFVTKLAPLMTTMLILSGKATSAAVFHPVLSGGIYIVALIVEIAMGIV